MLLNSAGEQKELACFEPAESGENSCSVNWKNQLFIYGGTVWRNQITQLIGYKLEPKGTLPFEHFRGACSVMAEQYIFLCFPDEIQDYNRCRRSTDPLWKKASIDFGIHRVFSLKLSLELQVIESRLQPS